MPCNQSFEEIEERERRSPDREPAQTSGAIAAESAGEVIEVGPTDSVDGDFNGAPELESLDRSGQWQGVDALDAMEGREDELSRESDAPEQALAHAIAERRTVLVERLDDARELGLGALFEAAIAATASTAGNTPTVVDHDVLRGQLAAIDAALEELEAKSG